MVFKLIEGFQSHHQNYLPSNFRNKNGVEAKTDNDNAKILNAHFQSVFNSEYQLDSTFWRISPSTILPTNLEIYQLPRNKKSHYKHELQ